jgi:hypothetical protein
MITSGSDPYLHGVLLFMIIVLYGIYLEGKSIASMWFG